MEKFKDLEERLVDKHHENFEMLDFPKEIALICMIKGFGDLEIQLSTLEHEYFDKSRHLYKAFLGLENCIKWILNSESEKKEKTPPDHSKAERMVGEFLQWGYDYNTLCDLHISKWRNYSTVNVDVNNRIVKFEPLKKEVLYFAFQQSLVSDETIHEQIDEISDDVLFQEFQNHIKQGNPNIISNKTSKKYFDFYNHLILPELDRNIDLGGYTIGDYITFITNAFIYFKFLFFRDFKKGFSRVYPLDEGNLIMTLSLMTTLEKVKIQEILKDFTFNPTKNVRLSNSPFIKNQNNYYISPTIITFLDPNRMLVGSLNKGHKKKYYDHFITQIEQRWTDELNEFLLGLNSFKTLYKKNYVRGGKRITPDFIIHLPSTNELMIIEYKHFVTPITISETFNKGSEVNKGNKQLLKYKEFLIAHPDVLDQYQINIENQRIYTLMLFRHPMPIPEIDDEINYCSVKEFTESIDKADSISGFLDLLNPKKKNNDFDKSKFTFVSQEIKIGSWVYQYETLGIKSDLESK